MATRQEMIDAVLDQIQEVRAAKIELQHRTRELVDAMRVQGKTREEGERYMKEVCTMVDARTARWAMDFFNTCWPPTPE